MTKKSTWQVELAAQITDPAQLWEALELDAALLPAAMAAAKLFPLKVTHSYLKRIKKGDINDPLLRQIMPLGIEQQMIEGYSSDPLGESKVNPTNGLLQKYHGRVLITLTSACAIHCRFCFRRHFPYDQNNPGRTGWQSIYDYINQDPQIQEVILSGGDPLSVSDDLLSTFTKGLLKIQHIKTIRLHTRIPIVLPSRITDEFIHWIEQLPYRVVIVLHANHANEINDEVHHAVNRLRQAGVVVLNQAVLLNSVNDDAITLIDLSHALFKLGILPYYLHMLDKVQGAAHFDVPLERALALHGEIKTQLPGYLVPRLSIEKTGELSKIML